MILTTNGQIFSCAKAIKGTDYIKLYDLNGNCVVTFSGISDFSGYSLTDDNNNSIELTIAKETKINQINQIAGEKIDGGFYSYAEGVKNADGTYKMLMYKSDLYHREQIDGMYSLVLLHAQNLLTTTSCRWKDASIDGECHNVTDAIMTQLYIEKGQHLMWGKLTSDALVANVNACTTVDEINAIVFPNEPLPITPTT